MRIENAIASLAVKDVATALPWYEALLGRGPGSTPMPSVAEWKFPGGGWLQLYTLPERAGNGSVTLSVTGLDALVEHLEALGLDTRDRPSSSTVRTVMIVDPDDNHIAFAESLDPGMAR